jgi:hypothetical protein
VFFLRGNSGSVFAVPFAYYQRLNRHSRCTYRLSDAVDTIRLPDGRGLESLTTELQSALARADAADVKRYATRLAQGICAALGVPSVRVRVLARRPVSSTEELHGLYDPESGDVPVITVWMRTAKRRQVVAFRTFLRTLLHELCHHLDYEYLKLEETFHTEGFYKRESSLFRQLVSDSKSSRREPPKAVPA